MSGKLTFSGDKSDITMRYENSSLDNPQTEKNEGVIEGALRADNTLTNEEKARIAGAYNLDKIALFQATQGILSDFLAKDMQSECEKHFSSSPIPNMVSVQDILRLSRSGIQPNGKLDAITFQTLIDFQKWGGLMPTGITDAATLNLLVAYAGLKAEKIRYDLDGEAAEQYLESLNATKVGAILHFAQRLGPNERLGHAQTRRLVGYAQYLRDTHDLRPNQNPSPSPSPQEVVPSGFNPEPQKQYNDILTRSHLGGIDAVQKILQPIKNTVQITGTFDQPTFEALQAFQSWAGIETTGYTDSVTIEALIQYRLFENLVADGSLQLPLDPNLTKLPTYSAEAKAYLDELKGSNVAERLIENYVHLGRRKDQLTAPKLILLYKFGAYLNGETDIHIHPSWNGEVQTPAPNYEKQIGPNAHTEQMWNQFLAQSPLGNIGEVQKILQLSKPELKVSGVLDTETFTTLGKFQAWSGLDVTHVTYPETIDMLIAYYEVEKRLQGGDILLPVKPQGYSDQQFSDEAKRYLDGLDATSKQSLKHLSQQLKGKEQRIRHPKLILLHKYGLYLGGQRDITVTPKWEENNVAQNNDQAAPAPIQPPENQELPQNFEAMKRKSESEIKRYNKHVSLREFGIDKDSIDLRDIQDLLQSWNPEYRGTGVYDLGMIQTLQTFQQHIEKLRQPRNQNEARKPFHQDNVEGIITAETIDNLLSIMEVKEQIEYLPQGPTAKEVIAKMKSLKTSEARKKYLDDLAPEDRSYYYFEFRDSIPANRFPNQDEIYMVQIITHLYGLQAKESGRPYEEIKLIDGKMSSGGETERFYSFLALKVLSDSGKIPTLEQFLESIVESGSSTEEALAALQRGDYTAQFQQQLNALSDHIKKIVKICGRSIGANKEKYKDSPSDILISQYGAFLEGTKNLSFNGMKIPVEKFNYIGSAREYAEANNVPKRWHGVLNDFFKRFPKNEKLERNTPIALASKKSKKVLFVYGNGTCVESKAIFGRGGSMVGYVAGGQKKTPTNVVVVFDKIKMASSVYGNAANGSSKTVMGASLQGPALAGAGGKWWHGVEDRASAPRSSGRINWGTTYGCVGTEVKKIRAFAAHISGSSRSGVRKLPKKSFGYVSEYVSLS